MGYKPSKGQRKHGCCVNGVESFVKRRNVLNVTADLSIILQKRTKRNERSRSSSAWLWAGYIAPRFQILKGKAAKQKLFAAVGTLEWNCFRSNTLYLTFCEFYNFSHKQLKNGKAHWDVRLRFNLYWNSAWVYPVQSGYIQPVPSSGIRGGMGMGLTTPSRKKILLLRLLPNGRPGAWGT